VPTSLTPKGSCDAGCERVLFLASTIKLLGALKKHGASWQEYAGCFLALLCNENTAEHCDRRPVLKDLDARGGGGIGIVHPHARQPRFAPSPSRVYSSAPRIRFMMSSGCGVPSGQGLNSRLTVPG
jgi:hypothetical protein